MIVSSKKPDRILPWMPVSVLIHFLLLGGLWFVAAPPAESIDERSRDQLEYVSREKLELAAEKLQDINRAEMEQNLESLVRMEDQMRRLQRDQAARLARDLANRPEEAARRALTLLEQIIAKQVTLLEAQSTVGVRLEPASRSLKALVDTQADAGRIGKFGSHGPGREAAEHFSKIGRDVNAAGPSINEVQALQIKLADELLWLRQPTLGELQADAIRAFEHAKRLHARTGDQIAWFRRDMDLLELRVGEYERVLDTKEMREHIRRQAQGSIQNLLRHPDEVVTRHAATLQAYEQAIAAQRELIRLLSDAPDPQPLEPVDFLAVASDGESQIDQPTSGPVDSGADDRQMSTDASSTTDTPDGSRQPKSNKQGATLSDMYDRMVETEERLGQMHRGVRAGAIVEASGLSPAAAIRQVHADAPARPIPDRESLDGKAGNGADFQRHQAALATALANSRAMVRSAESLLASAHAAAVGNGGLVIDAIATSTSPASSSAVRTGAAGRNTRGGAGPGDGNPSFFDAERARQQTMADVQSGRFITAANGGDGPWIFINGWYTIGPFTTGSSADLNRKYTPEALVDLDATYTGPDGRNLKWTFRQEAEPGATYFPVQNGNSVYYAFTHVRTDRAMEVMLALASDDASRLWVNGEPVESPDWHGTAANNEWLFSFGDRVSDYKVALHYRGYRLAHLRQGINTFLVRVENGPGGAGLAVYAKPSARHKP